MLSRRKKPRVLLLEDDPSMQRLVSKLLERQRYRVDVVSKGNDAIEALGRNVYEAVLLDVMMPHEGGMTVIAHMREKDEASLQRVILLTATPRGVLRKVERDVFAVVRKPFEPAELIATVARCTGPTK